MPETIKILLVEDEVDIQRANEVFLSARGYKVYCAETLERAQHILWENPPDLILLDVMLPDGSGFDFCREVRKTSTIPIIFLTAMGADGNIIGGLAMGGDDYIVKPYNMEIMGARVAAQLRRHGYSESIINLPPLTINLTSGRAFMNNNDLDLTPKEYQLLVFLVENRGQIVSQHRIYSAIWNSPAYTMGGTVRKHISRLRRKMSIKRDGVNYFEISSSEHGYRFLQVRYPAEE